MGLLLGSSIITVFELLDLIIYNCVMKTIRQGQILKQLAERDKSIKRKQANERNTSDTCERGAENKTFDPRTVL